MRFYGSRALTPLFFFSLLACNALRDPAPTTPDGIIRSSPDPERIYDLGTGEEITEGNLVGELLRETTIFLAADHESALDHSMQMRLLRALHRSDRQLAVAWPLIDPAFQQVMDDWSQGVLDEENFLREVEWNQRVGLDIRHFRPMMEFVRSNHLRFVAAGAEPPRPAGLSEKPSLVAPNYEPPAQEGEAPSGESDPNGESDDGQRGGDVLVGLSQQHLHVIVLVTPDDLDAQRDRQFASAGGANPVTVRTIDETDELGIQTARAADPAASDFLWVHAEP